MISHYVIDFGNVTYMSNITRWCNVTPINNIEKNTLANYVILRILVCACTDRAGIKAWTLISPYLTAGTCDMGG